MLYGPNTNNGSIIFMIECQVDYVMRQLKRLDDEKLAWLDVRRDVMDEYNDALQRDLDAVQVWQAGCHGYYRVPSGRIVTQWPHTMERVPGPYAAAGPRRIRSRAPPPRSPVADAAAMEFGLAIPHTGPPRVAGIRARVLHHSPRHEGFDGLWAVDHMVMPHHTESLYLLGPEPDRDRRRRGLEGAPGAQLRDDDDPRLGGGLHRHRIKLGTSIAVLPIRNPCQRPATRLARRVLRAAGWSTASASGGSRRRPTRWGCRGTIVAAAARSTSRSLRALWCADGDVVEFHGEFYDMPPMDPEPRPVQRPIPILIGGHSDAALDRAARIGDGWIAASMSPRRTGRALGHAAAAAERQGRDPAVVTAGRRDERDVGRSARRALVDLIGEYATMGVDHLQLGLFGRSPEATLDNVRRFADEVMPAFR